MIEQRGICQVGDSNVLKGLDQCRGKQSSARPLICKLIGVTCRQKDVASKTFASKARMELRSTY